MEFVINGQPRTFDQITEGATVEALIQALAIKADRVAIEQNGEIVPRKTWPQTPITSGDKFEIVHFVGGGL